MVVSSSCWRFFVAIKNGMSFVDVVVAVVVAVVVEKKEQPHPIFGLVRVVGLVVRTVPDEKPRVGFDYYRTSVVMCVSWGTIKEVYSQ